MLYAGPLVEVVHGALVHATLNRTTMTGVIAGGNPPPAAPPRHPPHNPSVGAGHAAQEGRGVAKAGLSGIMRSPWKSRSIENSSHGRYLKKRRCEWCSGS